MFFDTFGEFYDDLKQFHDHIPNLLMTEDSVYSFFNGLAGTNGFFHDVYNRVVVADLWECGVECRFEGLTVCELGDDVWIGCARKYYSLCVYDLPICKLIQ